MTSPCPKHERRFWVEIVTPDPDHATPDNPNHVSVASYCAMCVNERLIDENKELISELEESNSLLRSANSIAERRGEQTNWDAFEKKLKRLLEHQFNILRKETP